MKLIDKYIHTVTRYLPEKTRDDVAKELRANIEEMLPPNASERQVEEVLRIMGNPWQLARDYQPNKRYLIGPQHFDNYLSVLKKVVIIVMLVFLALGLFEWMFNQPRPLEPLQATITFFTVVFSSIVSALFQAVVWVTVVFAIIERTDATQAKQPTNHWSTKDLAVPVERSLKIPMADSIIGLVFLVIFTVVLLTFGSNIGVFFVRGQDGSLLESVPIFVASRFNFYLPIFLTSMFLQGMIDVWKLVGQKWDIKLAIANAVVNVIGVVITAIIVLDHTLFNPEFYDRLGTLLGVSPLNIAISAGYIALGFVVVVGVGSLIDSVIPFFKLARKSR